MEKERVLVQEIASLNEKYSTVLEKINNLEAKLSKKRAKLSTISQENARISGFFALFGQENPQILTQLSSDFLAILEKSLISLQDGIKTEKMLRSWTFSLQKQENFQENAEFAVNSLRNSLSKASFCDLREKFCQEICVFQEKTAENRESQSFRTFFEEKREFLSESRKFEAKESSASNGETLGFEGKLAELQRNFSEITEKIKEKTAISQENDRSFARKDGNRSPVKGFSLQNKENVAKIASFGKNSLKKGEKSASPFEKHLEALRNNNKIV